jgi:hypothetical protein
VNTFERYGCGCNLVVSDDGKEVLVCKFRRQWKLRNIGKPISNDYWTNPSVIMIYKFNIDHNNVIKDLDVDMIDVSSDMHFPDNPITIK